MPKLTLHICAISSLALLGSVSFAPDSAAQDGLYGQLYMTAAHCRRGSVEAKGQHINIDQNPALYSLLGTTYGGDDEADFAVPDLRSRTPVGVGAVQGGIDVARGARIGEDRHVLTSYPAHDHAEVGHSHSDVTHTHSADVVASSQNADTPSPSGSSFPTYATSRLYALGAPDGIRMAEGAVQTSEAGPAETSVEPAQYQTTGMAGVSDAAIDVRDPFLGIKFCIVTEGTYPSRP